jgi:hypothetical protein
MLHSVLQGCGTSLGVATFVVFEAHAGRSTDRAADTMEFIIRVEARLAGKVLESRCRLEPFLLLG